VTNGLHITGNAKSSYTENKTNAKTYTDWSVEDSNLIKTNCSILG